LPHSSNIRGQEQDKRLFLRCGFVDGRASFALTGRIGKAMNSLMDKSEIYPSGYRLKAFTALPTLKTYRPQAPQR